MARVRGLEVSGPDALFAAQHVLGDDPVPGVVVDLAGAGPAELVWGNELGGLTFRIGDRFVTWNPLRTGIDLDRERLRLEWLNGRHAAPRVLAWGQDAQAQWLVTTAVPGEHAVGATWRARCRAAIAAIAAGLRALHAIATDDFPPPGRPSHGWGAPPRRWVPARTCTIRCWYTVTPAPRTR